MFRSRRADQEDKSTTDSDWGFRIILGLIGVTTAWILATPWIPSVALSTMHRFHLTSSSFIGWAIQQPIPPMYNFANRFTIYDQWPPGPESELPKSDDSQPDATAKREESRFINHFPARVITFGTMRYWNLKDSDQFWCHLESDYRDLEVDTFYHVWRRADGRFEMQRLDMDVNHDQ